MPELLVYYGESPDAVLDQMARAREETSRAGDQSGFLKQHAWECRKRFNTTDEPAGVRAALTALTEGELGKKLAQMIKMIGDQPETPFAFFPAGLFYGRGAPMGRTAYLFPGQGAQYLGMGGPLAAAFPAARRVWASLGQMRFDGTCIEEVVFPRSAAGEEAAKEAFLRLSAADWTNPCIAVAGEAIFTLLDRLGLRPSAVGAHSFGDISALRAAGVLSARQMIELTRCRGELGVSCPLATRGCILAVPESAETVRAVLDQNGITDVWIANYNTPTQTVLSGVREAVSRAHAAFEAEGIKSRMIPISAAPHCPLAVDVARDFAGCLEKAAFGPATCDVYSFLFGRRVPNQPGLFRKLLKAHIEKPVRFQSQIEQMYKDGIRIFVEIGPGNMLSSLVDQILEDRPHMAVPTDHKKKDSVLAFLNAVAALFKEGLIHDLDGLGEADAEPAEGLKQALYY